MKTLITLTLVAATLISCTKAEMAKPTTSSPVTSGITTTTDTGIVGHWQYAYDTCRKLVITTDSITSITCDTSVITHYTHLGGDTVMLYGQKYILKAVGDTLYKVPEPANIWDSKYYRIP